MIGGQRNGWCSESMNKPRAASGFLKNTKLKSMFHLKALKALLQSSTIIALGNGLHTCRQWFCVTPLANFDFYFCLRGKFHKSSFWVPILAAEGPYLMKSWVPIGSLFLCSQVPISFTHSAVAVCLILQTGPGPWKRPN